MLRVYLAAFPKIEVPARAFFPTQAAAFVLATSCRASGLAAAIILTWVGWVTRSAPGIFCLRRKTGMSRLFRTYPTPLSQYAMM